jgi:hypothetical protein
MIFKPSDRERAIIFIDKLFEKKKFVKIEYVAEAKSLSQNAYLWLVFTHIAEETGATKEDMYYYFLDKFSKFKEIEHLGETKLIRISLSSFTKEQTTKFIDEVVTDARQEGFDVPDCDTQKALEMMNYYRQTGIL